MASAMGTLLRLQRRARSRGRAARLFGGAMLVTAFVAAYALGQELSVSLAAGEPARALRAATGLLVLVAGLVSFAGALLSTLGLLLGEVRDEDEHLAALPLTFRHIAASRLANVTIRAMRAAILAALVGLASVLGVWRLEFIASVGETQLAVWSVTTCIAVLLEVLVCTVVGTLAVLAFGRLVPARWREVALVVVALGAAFGAVLAAVRLGPLLASATTAEVKAWLWVPLAPVRAALRLQRAMQSGGVEAILGAVGFSAAAAILLGLAIHVWARLLRYDLESAARPAHEHTLAAATAVPRASTDASSVRQSTVLERFVGWFPSPARAVLVRDLTQMGRTPAVRLRSAMLAIALVALAATGFHPFWLLLLLYYASSEIARDALLPTLEEEGENLFFLQVVTPGLKSYLRLRGLAGCLITVAATLFLLTVATLLSPALTADISALLVRSALLVTAAWLAVASSIVCAAVFVLDLESSGKSLAVSPAELPVAACGIAVALMCTVLDLHWLNAAYVLNHSVATLPTWLHGATAGLLVAGLVATPLAFQFAARRIQLRGIG